jgi:hypothetical protein
VRGVFTWGHKDTIGRYHNVLMRKLTSDQQILDGHVRLPGDFPLVIDVDHAFSSIGKGAEPMYRTLRPCGVVLYVG